MVDFRIKTDDIKDLPDGDITRYHFIYQEQEKTAPVKPVPPSKRILGHKRNETNGKYGIWAHDLEDLRLEECKVYRKKDGSILLTLKIVNELSAVAIDIDKNTGGYYCCAQ